jgi:hypothetical protein
MLAGSNAERLKSGLSPPHAFLSLRHATLDGAHSAIKIHCLFVLSNQHRIVITRQKYDIAPLLAYICLSLGQWLNALGSMSQIGVLNCVNLTA